jgi:hypothetical protein
VIALLYCTHHHANTTYLRPFRRRFGERGIALNRFVGLAFFWLVSGSATLSLSALQILMSFEWVVRSSAAITVAIFLASPVLP